MTTPASRELKEMREAIYRIRTNIESHRKSFGEEWQDWMTEIVSDLTDAMTTRAQASAPEGEVVALLTMAYRAGFIMAGHWPHCAPQDVDYPAFAKELRTFIEKHTPITRSNAKAGEVEMAVRLLEQCIDDYDAPNYLGTDLLDEIKSFISTHDKTNVGEV